MHPGHGQAFCGICHSVHAIHSGHAGAKVPDAARQLVTSGRLAAAEPHSSGQRHLTVFLVQKSPARKRRAFCIKNRAMLLVVFFPAVTTPFYPDGAVYYKKIEHNIDRYSRTPIAGMVMLGSTGEAVMLGDEERREVLRVTAEVASPEKVLIAGTGAESVIETLRLTEYAAQLHYDAALVRTPHFYRPQMKPEALLAFYRAVADRSPLPVLLYTVPPFTAYDLPLEVITA